ncbi:MAG: lasso peptide biosynthesis B2 protein [Mycobacterium sp.]|uniref:lasso peptide biosynthesis B2 protein n=1 Tax=Mycobacterium sp. TaxID=1785 RepID=UPI003C5D3D5F
MAAIAPTPPWANDDSSDGPEMYSLGAVVISPHVRVSEVDGLTLVMDLPTSAFYFLDEDATHMWRELRSANGSVVSAKEALGGGDESSRRLAGMLDAFVATCMARGFLDADHLAPAHGVGPTPRPRRLPRRSLLTARAWLWMLRMGFALRREGFGSVYQTLGHSVGQAIASATSVDVKMARQAFLRAENFYVRRRAPNDCLPRSLSLYAYMRGLGLPVVHRIGARRFPAFRCHAWVEYDGEPILDELADVNDYTVIASM